jgi:hypothetical protein
MDILYSALVFLHMIGLAGIIAGFLMQLMTDNPKSTKVLLHSSLLQLVTGLLSLRAGSPPTAPLFWTHGLLGGALLAAVALKLRRSLPGALAHRRWGRLTIASLLTAIALGALVSGIVLAPLSDKGLVGAVPGSYRVIGAHGGAAHGPGLVVGHEVVGRKVVADQRRLVRGRDDPVLQLSRPQRQRGEQVPHAASDSRTRSWK